MTNLSLPVAHFFVGQTHRRKTIVPVPSVFPSVGTVGHPSGNEIWQSLGQRMKEVETRCQPRLPDVCRRIKSAVGQRAGQRNVTINLGNGMGSELGNDPTDQKMPSVIRRGAVGSRRDRSDERSASTAMP